MTIAAGFRCNDGVVLCADTQINAGVSKFPESKMRMYGQLTCAPVFVFAGDVEFSTMAIDIIADAIEDAEAKKSRIIEAVRSEAIKVYTRYRELSPDGRDFELQTIGAFLFKRKWSYSQYRDQRSRMSIRNV